MNIVIVGNDAAFAEAIAKFGDTHQYQWVKQSPIEPKFLSSVDVVFDFTSAWSAETLMPYAAAHTTPVFLNSVFTTLSDLISHGKLSQPVFGFCGLPTFFNRSILEITSANPADAEILTSTMGLLNTEFKIVKDQVGMITARVVCMIINEANEALKQGVASREDIDLSMKLGTNYPLGPFEWGDKIGTENVRRLLKSLEEITGDSRYRAIF